MKSSVFNSDPECLLFFVDDTGHERLAGDHTVYGLGGCAVLASDLDDTINNPWRDIREKVHGAADAPLHASEFSRNATEDKIIAIATFFEKPTFMRLAAVASISTKIPAEMELAFVVLSVLGGRIQQLVDRVPLRQVAVIFEHSQRARSVIERNFSDFSVTKDGHNIPVELLWMPKSANQPGMEVADFVMHAVLRQERKAIRGVSEFNLDFAAVFMKVPSRLISFQKIDGVIGDYPNEMVAGHELR